MDWATVFVGFAIIYSVFTSQFGNESYQLPPKHKPLVKNLKRITPKKPVSSKKSSGLAYSETRLNDYQVIVSYIMDKYKRVKLTEILDISENIVKYSIENEVDPLLITALISVESSFNRKAVSKAGAKGLGQMMPFNFKRFGISDPFNVEQNVRATTSFIRILLNQWDGNLSYALASYLEGATSVKRYLRKNNNRLRNESQRYVNKISSRYEKLKVYQ
jgi:soluble lytic murein transglycosylase-like protein